MVKNKRLSDIKLDTMEARDTQADLMGLDDDPSEAQEQQTRKVIDNVTTAVEGGERLTSQQNTSSIDEDEEIETCENASYCSRA